MSGPLQSITSDMVTKALDISLQVHQTIANNIANAETSGYRPLSVDFDTAMQQVRAAVQSGAGDDQVRAALNSVVIQPQQDPANTSVLLDEQIVELVQNTVHYQALLNARGMMGDIMSLAIKGGQG